MVYRHRDFQPHKPFILISSHIDSAYKNYFASDGGEEIFGTLDNSATNAILVQSMSDGAIPIQSVVAFTGDEEEDSLGAQQTIAFLKETASGWSLPEMTITLDLTEECYATKSFTIENYFVSPCSGNHLLVFDQPTDLKDYITRKLKEEDPAFIEGAEPDESWQYRDNHLHCFSLCLPCRVLADDMHSDEGVAVRAASLDGFAATLSSLARSIANDLIFLSR